MATGLAYIGRVESIKPIDGADRIEQVEVVCGEGGRWNGVVQKGQFQTGSQCIAYLQDAVIPASQEMAFMERSNWRVKMARFKGVPSECVIVPACEGSVGDDVTDLLGVTKYEKASPANLDGESRGNFPSFIPKTDEPNFQRSGRMIEQLIGKPWVATVKCDGSSTTAYKHNGEFGVCSRNLEKMDTPQSGLWNLARKYDLQSKLPEGIAIQWETCGPGVQKNPLGLSELDARVFNAYDIANHRYIDHDEMVLLCDEIGIPTVPVELTDDCFVFDKESLLKMAEGVYANGKQREGIVIRPRREEWCGQSRLSFKVINLLYKE